MMHFFLVQVKKMDVKILGQYSCSPGLKVAWQQRKNDPTISDYTIHVKDTHDREIVDNISVEPNGKRRYRESISIPKLFHYSTVQAQVVIRRQKGVDTEGPVETKEVKKGKNACTINITEYMSGYNYNMLV